MANNIINESPPSIHLYDEKSNTSDAVFSCRKPKNILLFLSQVVVIYIIVIAAIIQISLQNPNPIWLMLLTSSVGYILPAPKLKLHKLKT